MYYVSFNFRILHLLTTKIQVHVCMVVTSDFCTISRFTNDIGAGYPAILLQTWVTNLSVLCLACTYFNETLVLKLWLGFPQKDFLHNLSGHMLQTVDHKASKAVTQHHCPS